MNFILKLLDIYSYYEAAILLGFMLLGILVGIALNQYLTHNRKLSLIYLAGLAIVPVVTGLFIYLTETLLGETSSGLSHIALVIVTTFTLLNLLQLSIEHNRETRAKRFDPDHITRAHFNQTLNTAFVVITSSIAVTLFLATQLLIVPITVMLSLIITFALNHLLARLILREKA